MAGSRLIRAGQAFIEFTTKDGKLVKGLRRAQQRLSGFGDSVAAVGTKLFALGTAGAAALFGAAKHFATAGDAVAKMSKRTGVGVQALSELGFAAERSGTSMEAIEKALRGMARLVLDAQRGLSTATDTLDDLGLTLEDIQGLSPEDAFTRISGAIAKIEDPTLRAAVAMKAFGRTGTELLPLIMDDVAGLRQAARELFVITEEEAAAAEVLNDALGDAGYTLKGLVFVAGAAVADIFTALALRIARVASEAINLVRRNQDLIVAILKISAIVAGAGAALLTFAVLIKTAAFTIGAFLSIITGVKAVLGLLASAFLLLTNPITLTIGLIVGIGAAIAHTTGAGARLLEWLGDRFADLLDHAHATFRGIADALVAGDITAAAEVLFASLEVIWVEGTNALARHWREFLFGIQAAWEISQNFLARSFASAWTGMEQAWSASAAFFKETWGDATGWVADRMLEAQGLVDEGFDVEGAKAERQKETEFNRDRIRKQREQELLDIAMRGRDTLQNLEAEHQQKMTELSEADTKARTDAAKKLAEAQAKFDKAREGAAAARERAESEPPPEVEDFTERWRKIFEGLGGGLDERLASIGTFNAAALQGLQSGPIGEKKELPILKGILDSGKRTNRLLEQQQFQVA